MSMCWNKFSEVSQRRCITRYARYEGAFWETSLRGYYAKRLLLACCNQQIQHLDG